MSERAMHGPDWKKLRHAHGPATSIPAYVERLAGDDGRQRDSAYLLLIDAFRSEGRWFSANAPTLDALFAVLPLAAEPGMVFAVMADVLTSDHVSAWAAERPPRVPEQAAPAFDAVQRRLAWLCAALQSERASTRAGAAMLLAFIADDVQARGALSAALSREVEPSARASLLLAVSGGGDDDVRSALVSAEAHDDPLVRGAASVARLRFDPSWHYRDATGGVLAWLSQERRIAPPHAEPALPWFDGSLRHLEPEPRFPAVTALLALARRRAHVESLVDAAVEWSRSLHGEASRRLGHLVLDAGRFGSDASSVVLPSELDALQRSVAERIASTLLLPGAGHGLPAAGVARRRWLGQTAPGPLDTLATVELDGERVELPRWKIWRELLKRGAPEARYIPPLVETGLSPLDRLETLVTFMARSYGFSIHIDDAAVEQELGRVPHDGALFERLTRIADDLASRYGAAQREKRWEQPGRDVAALLLTPFVRAGRAIEERWDPLVHVGKGGEALLSALPLARREALICERVSLAGDGDTAIALGHVIPVVQHVATRGVLAHLLRAMAALPRHEGDRNFRHELEAAARRRPEVRSALDAAVRER